MSEPAPAEEEGHDPHYLAVVNEHFTVALREYEEPHWFLITPAVVPGKDGDPTMAIMVSVLRRGVGNAKPIVQPVPVYDILALLDYGIVEMTCRATVELLKQQYMKNWTGR